MTCKSILSFSFVVFFALACGKGNNNGNTTPVTTEKLGNLGFRAMPLFKKNGDTIGGSGALLFDTAPTKPSQAFTVQFQLEPGGSLILATNSNDSLTSGARFAFRSVGGELVVNAFVVGQKESELKFAIDPTTLTTAVIEVHVHDVGDAHVHVRINGGKEKSLPLEAPGDLRATRFGLILDKVKSVKAPTFTDSEPE